MQRRNNSERYRALNESLVMLEVVMRNLGVWADKSPPPDAFLSQQPFCYDTMSLPQWLQFIFLPKMNELIATELPLPTQCGISPMAEDYVKATSLVNGRDLIDCLYLIDEKLGGLNKN